MVSLELRESAVTDRADVVFPVAPVVEKAGSFVNWEGRIRPFEPSLRTNAAPDLRVLHFLADEIGVDLGLPDRVGRRRGTGPPRPVGRHPPRAPPEVAPAAAARPGQGQAVLAGWRMLLDAGRLQDGEPYLAGTARTPRGAAVGGHRRRDRRREGDLITVGTDRGEITLPLAITDMDDRVVWLPLNSAGSAGAPNSSRVTVGAVVSIGRAEP